MIEVKKDASETQPNTGKDTNKGSGSIGSENLEEVSDNIDKNVEHSENISRINENQRKLADTGVESNLGMFGMALAALAGIFGIKKKDEDND